jgi:nitrilase
MKDTRVAIVQDAPVLFDLGSTLEKVDSLLAHAKASDPDLVLFPEAFISGYPRGITFGTVVGKRAPEGREMWQMYYDSSMEIGSAEFQALQKIIKKHSVHTVIGIIEKVPTGTLYCTVCYFNPKGELLGRHRKLKPTAAERLVWGEGAGDDLDVYDLPFGKTGALICWENYMPLARTWMYHQGVEIYLAPTADYRDSWQHSMKHIAVEGRCYVLNCNQFVTQADYPNPLPGESLKDWPEVMSPGGSSIIGPLGDEIVSPLYNEPGILTATLSADALTQSKLDFDVAGHYSRQDVFELRNRALRDK